RGASKGEGLGNQFLANIRETHAILHVLRCFEDDNVTHVEGGVDPVRDAETVETELMIADMESLARQIAGIEKKAKSGDKELKAQLDFMLAVKAVLDEGRPARTVTVPDDQRRTWHGLQLLSS